MASMIPIESSLFCVSEFDATYGVAGSAICVTSNTALDDTVVGSGSRMVSVTGLAQPSSPPWPLWAQRLYLFQSGVVAELGSVMSTLYGFPVAWTHPSNTSA